MLINRNDHDIITISLRMNSDMLPSVCLRRETATGTCGSDGKTASEHKTPDRESVRFRRLFPRAEKEFDTKASLIMMLLGDPVFSLLLAAGLSAP